MPATTGKIGLGTLIKMGDGQDPEVFTSIANVADINGPNESMETVDSTHLNSTGGYREFLAHLKDGGEVALTCHYDPNHATHDGSTGLRKKYIDRILTNFQIDTSAVITSGNNLISFAAYVINLGPQFSVDNLIGFDVTLKVSGAVSIGTAS